MMSFSRDCAVGSSRMRWKKRSGSATLGLLQAYVPNEGDAWSFTLTKVKNYLEHLLVDKDRARVSPPEIPFFPADLKTPIENRGAREMVGEMFAQMVAILARRTGELHLALASLSHSPEFTPEPFSTIYQRSIYQSMLSLTRSVFRSLDKSLPDLPEAFKPLARSVLASQTRMIERFSRITGKKISGMKIRIHGNYHLEQVLFTGKDFMIIDFEGEPLRPLSERRLKRSPLRDVAGMLRSFHYAAFVGLFQFVSIHPVTTDELEGWMKPWVHYVSNVFLDTYLETVKGAPFIPSHREELVSLLDAFLLEKAIYELSYELNNRPDWVFLPLKGIASLLAEEHGQERKG